MGITQETRLEAYLAVLPKAPTKEAQVLAVLRRYGRQTAEEIMERMGTGNPNNVRPRLTGLKKKGLVRDVEKRRDRDGHMAAVWEAVEHVRCDG